ncbi:hypothetical protein L1D34_07125 [Vibrio mediterranei]|uniref:hypothetical protein n=1 Tax=Vibrio mediterranei TaxID=689 RepID=UPI001EFE2BFA|nr:hypothetical protein [Vibrio mediterranei]MCG9624610.1 hypothetical protein [Vibrio mediterranei]
MLTERQAQIVLKKLRQLGCNVVTATKTPRGVLITIEKPTVDMTSKAVEIRQNFKGTRSTVYSLQMDGCTVNWGGLQCQVH